MEHLAIDLGGRESQVCIRSESGEVVEERRVRTRHLAAYLRRRPRSRVIVETCAESFAIADAALAQGHEIRVVPATLVRSLGVGARGVKTDRRDARILSEVSARIDLPSVHVPSEESRRRKSLCSMREALVSARVQLTNCVKGWLRTQTLRLRSGALNTFGKRLEELCEKELEGGMPSHVQWMVLSVDALTGQIRRADKELKQLAEKDEVCCRLMTMPGVGPVCAVRFAAAIDSVERFESAHKLESYLGLVPGERSSSMLLRRTGITKAGAPRVRWVLGQAAWVARRCRPSDPMVLWSKEVEHRRGKHVAVTALARKMAGILYAMWRDETVYEPRRGAAASPPQGKELLPPTQR